MKKCLLCFLLLSGLFAFPFCVYAEDNPAAYEDYLSAYDLSFFEETLDEDTYSFLETLGLDSFRYDTIASLSFHEVFRLLTDMLRQKAQNPLKSGASVLLLVVLSALFQSFKTGGGGTLDEVYATISALVISTVLVVKISSAVTISTICIKTAASFIYAFVPIFCAVVTASGGVTASFSTNAMLMMLSQGMNVLAAQFFMPVVNSFLAISICAGLREELQLQRLTASLKKGIAGLLTTLCTGFVSVLSLKTAVASRADALGLRSLRFVISSAVPVIGNAVSEGLLSIQSYSSLIKSSVGVVGITAVALVFLPSVLELAVWRIVLTLCSLIGDAFGSNSVSRLLDAFQDALQLMQAVLILCAVTTVISIGILIAAGGG